MAVIKCVCISTERKASARSVGQCSATLQGLAGDVHYKKGEKHVSMLPFDRVEAYFAERKEPILYGRFGENLVVEGLDWSRLYVGERFLAGDVVLEIVRLGAGGPASDAYKGEKVCAPMEELFVFCKILREGILKENMGLSKEERG